MKGLVGRTHQDRQLLAHTDVETQLRTLRPNLTRQEIDTAMREPWARRRIEDVRIAYAIADFTATITHTVNHTVNQAAAAIENLARRINNRGDHE